MAYDVPGISYTFRATTGLKQYQAVHITTGGRILNPTTEGNCIGILISSGTTGSTGRAGSTDSGSVQTVQLTGIAKVIAGTTTIAVANALKTEADGRASTSSSTSYRFGIALAAVDSTSTSAHVIPVLLTPSAANFA